MFALSLAVNEFKCINTVEVNLTCKFVIRFKTKLTWKGCCFKKGIWLQMRFQQCHFHINHFPLLHKFSISYEIWVTEAKLRNKRLRGKKLNFYIQCSFKVNEVIKKTFCYLARMLIVYKVLNKRIIQKLTVLRTKLFFSHCFCFR